MNNQSTINLDDPKNYIQPIPLVDSARFEDTQSIKVAEHSPKKTAPSMTQNTPNHKTDNVAQQTAQSQKIDYSVKNVESDIKNTTNYAFDIFSKSNIIVFVWFIAIYFIIFIIVQRLLMKQEAQQSSSQSIASIFTGESYQSNVETPEMTTSRLVDFTLLIVFIVLCVVGYQSLSKYDQEHFIKYCWNWMREDLNNPTSVFVFSFILLAFYLTTYLLNIPMGAEKPLSISIIESKLWIWLVLLIIAAFCKYVLNVPIVDWFFNWVEDLWTSSNFYKSTTNSSNNLPNKYHNVLIDNAGDFKIIPPPAPIVSSGSSQMPPVMPPVMPPAPPLAKPIVGSGSGSGSSVKFEYDEVFNIGNNLYTYDDAQAVCKAFGARLATYGEIEQSYNDGAEWCNYGWSQHQMALFPTQAETYKNLSFAFVISLRKNCSSILFFAFFETSIKKFAGALPHEITLIPKNAAS
jgi:hypothetical protein